MSYSLKSRPDGKHLAAKIGAAGLAIALLSGCVSARTAPPASGPIIKQSVKTAPADLQLLCSTAAARKFGFSPSEILPVDSEALSQDAFRVNIRSKSSTMRCVVTKRAEILELVRI
ncbi:hypothetical protein [Maritalea sp.]|uniref:hypothetical protein n=1 Tax=Maritalea sp. TaxID=2003361 RepID=UPI003EF10270